MDVALIREEKHFEGENTLESFTLEAFTSKSGEIPISTISNSR